MPQSAAWRHMTRSTKEELRSKLLRPYREKRTTPRPDLRPGSPGAFEDPAPPWVPAVLDTLLPRLGHEKDGGYRIVSAALHWCSQGEGSTRATRLLTIVTLWPGPFVGDIVESFLDAAISTGAGRPAGCKPRKMRAVSIPADWGVLSQRPMDAPPMSEYPSGGPCHGRLGNHRFGLRALSDGTRLCADCGRCEPGPPALKPGEGEIVRIRGERWVEPDVSISVRPR